MNVDEKLFGVSDMHPDVRPGGIHRQAVGVRAMMQQDGTAESQIKAVIEAWADAVRRHDLSGILAHHQQDIVMFDVPPPLQSRGMDEYKKTWDLFFRYHKPSQAFDIEELAITAGEDVAFAAAIMRCGSGTSSGPPEEGGFLFRLTIGLRNVDGDWRIAHEDHSVPSTD
jgi:ketosteroid isomerase-like protein